MTDIESTDRQTLNRISLALGYLLLLAASFPLTDLSTTISYIILSVLYGVVLLVAGISLQNIVISRIYLALLGILSVHLIFNAIINISIGVAIRLGAFFTFTITNLIIMPRIIRFKNIIFITARYSALLVVIGFLPYLGIQNLPGGLSLSFWGGYLYLYPELQPITSIFSNPNALGFVLLTGLIAAVTETWYTGKRLPAVLIIVNATGLLFTNYRTGMVSSVIVLTILAVYAIRGRERYLIAVMGGLTTFGIVLMMMFNLLPWTGELTELSLNGRRPLWQNTVDAILKSPLVGVGLGGYTEIVQNPHNSYLRMSLALGIGGGLIYLIFVIRTILQSAREAANWKAVGISLYLVAFFFVQMMNSLTFIGVSYHSIFISLIIGYHIQHDASIGGTV